MSLKEKIQSDWKEAMKARDRFRASTLNMAKAAILQIEKNEKRELTDEDVSAIVLKEIKKRKDAIEQFRLGGREDLVNETSAEIEILSGYLPEQLTVDKITEIINTVISEVGANSVKDMGKVMKAVQLEVKGRADGKLVSSIVRKQLMSL
ncbi:GatB/YqeY domain-containing protein [Clostridium sp. DL1XJH146]